jgi:DNA mismatch repair protein MutL
VIVDQLYAAIPVREKYLKSDATEWKYIRQLIMTYALIHFDKTWTLIHNGKQTLHLPTHASVIERATHLFQASRESKWTPFEYKDQQLHCRGLRGDASLHFPTSQHVYLVVNGRPVTDKLLRKAVLTAYQRQIVP